MPKLVNGSVGKYLDGLASRAPAPGGGSAAALTAALGAALISMAAQYALKKDLPQPERKRLVALRARSEKIRLRLQTLVDLDADVYLGVVAARGAAPGVKKAALRKAARVPLETARLAYQAIDLTPVLVLKGSKYLVSDVEAAVEFLFAAFKSAMINVKANQEAEAKL